MQVVRHFWTLRIDVAVANCFMVAPIVTLHLLQLCGGHLQEARITLPAIFITTRLLPVRPA